MRVFQLHSYVHVRTSRWQTNHVEKGGILATRADSTEHLKKFEPPNPLINEVYVVKSWIDGFGRSINSKYSAGERALNLVHYFGSLPRQFRMTNVPKRYMDRVGRNKKTLLGHSQSACRHPNVIFLLLNLFWSSLLYYDCLPI